VTDRSAASQRERLAHEALRSLSARVEALARYKLPPPDATRRASARIDAEATKPVIPLGERLLEARRAVITALEARDLGRLSLRHLRDAPWLLWSEDEPLAGRDGLLDHLASQAGQRSGLRRALIQAWLIGFSEDGPGISEGGMIIRRLLTRSTDTRLDVWRRAQNRFRLFEPEHGPGHVALEILRSSEPVADVLAAAGLGSAQLATRGYARAIHRRVTEMVGDALASSGGEALARCAAFVSPRQDASPARGQLRFSDLPAMGLLADGLLAPWLSTTRRPPHDEVRRSVQAFLLDHLLDPRINPARWQSAKGETRDLIRRWLDEATFEAFFQLIEEYSPEEQFQYRKAFWSAYLERGLIDRLWIALGGTIHSSARSVAELRGSFGRLKGAGGTDAVLMMRVGNVVLCEWSRIGKLRAWKADWRGCPRLDEFEYTADLFRTKGLNFPKAYLRYKGESIHHPASTDGLRHDMPERSYWQASAGEFMRQVTGVGLTPEEWMP
jgi:hypothetical protein